jgi:hypothetical protein
MINARLKRTLIKRFLTEEFYLFLAFAFGFYLIAIILLQGFCTSCIARQFPARFRHDFYRSTMTVLLENERRMLQLFISEAIPCTSPTWSKSSD